MAAQTQYESNRRKLQLMWERLRRESTEAAEETPQMTKAPGDVTDTPTHNADHDVEGLLAELEVGRTRDELLLDVEDALARLKDGEYGRCERCGGEISSDRLDALPQARFCVECERREEAAESP